MASPLAVALTVACAWQTGVRVNNSSRACMHALTHADMYMHALMDMHICMLRHAYILAWTCLCQVTLEKQACGQSSEPPPSEARPLLPCDTLSCLIVAHLPGKTAQSLDELVTRSSFECERGIVCPAFKTSSIDTFSPLASCMDRIHWADGC